MAKLALFLPDGSPMDLPLDQERITIGRRADNDICLPNLAVSGEHAAVVTILADSFLEDLGSTNGTLVNGKSITKHFLRDGDEVDIGRHKFVYCEDDRRRVEPRLPTGMARVAGRDLGEQVEAAKPFVRQLQPQAHPVGRDVIEIVEVDAAHGEGAQRVKTRGRCHAPGCLLFSGWYGNGTKPTKPCVSSCNARNCRR